jgi:hypothetical protein
LFEDAYENLFDVINAKALSGSDFWDEQMIVSYTQQKNELVRDPV